ncbi:MAG: hypothetical protein WCI94_02560 [Rhodospirillales bacterium]
MIRSIARVLATLAACFLLAGCLVSNKALFAPDRADFPLPDGTTLIQVGSTEPGEHERGRAVLIREDDGYRLRALSGVDFAEQNNTLFQLKRIDATADTVLYALQTKRTDGAGWRYASVMFWSKSRIANFRMFDGVGNCAELRAHGLMRNGMAEAPDGCSVPDFATLTAILRQDSKDRAVNSTSRIYRVQ